MEAGVDGARRAYASARELLEQRTHESQRFDRLKAEYDLRARELHAQEALLQEMIRRAADEMAGVAPAAATTPVPAGGFSVSVLGAVNRQGSVAFAATEKPIVLDAIARAGGFAANASRRGVRLIRVDAAGVRSTRELTEENLMAGDGDAGALRPGDVIFVPEKIR